MHKKKLQDDIDKISDAEASIGFNKITVHKDLPHKLRSPDLDHNNMTKADILLRQMELERQAMVQQGNATNVTLSIVKVNSTTSSNSSKPIEPVSTVPAMK
jgi:hypothetical protein